MKCRFYIIYRTECVKVYPYNKNQLDALFTFSLFQYLFVGSFLPAASQHKRMTYTNCCIYRAVPPDDEQ